MDTFVVRVYRNKPDTHDDFAGLLEHIGTCEPIPFHSLTELVMVIREICITEQETTDLA